MLASAKPFEQAFDSFARSNSGSSQWMTALHQSSKENFLAQGLPTLKDEEWKYISLRPLQQNSFRWMEPSSEPLKEFLQDLHIPDAHTIVMVDGHVQVATLSGLNFEILPLGKALAQNSDLLAKLLKNADSTHSNAFTTLNQAFLKEGCCILLKSGEKVTKNVHLLNIINGSADPRACFTRNLIHLEKNAELNLIETVVSADHASSDLVFCNTVTDLILEEGAQISYKKFQRQGNAHIYTGHTRCYQQRASHVNAFFDTCGGGLSHEGISVKLVGEQAEAKLRGLFHTHDREHTSYSVFVEHAASYTKSYQLFKGVAEGHSRGVFNAQIEVREGLKQINARQLTKNLLLGKDAEIDAKPTLLIDSDDVKCSHGAAIGRLRNDEIFYLEARGIPKLKAEAILSAAFTHEVLLDIKDEKAKDEILKHQFQLAQLFPAAASQGGLAS